SLKVSPRPPPAYSKSFPVGFLTKLAPVSGWQCLVMVSQRFQSPFSILLIAGDSSLVFAGPTGSAKASVLLHATPLSRIRLIKISVVSLSAYTGRQTLLEPCWGCSSQPYWFGVCRPAQQPFSKRPSKLLCLSVFSPPFWL